jgi:photosystem II stability/assembly factor-like uncharacterized protein
MSSEISPAAKKSKFSKKYLFALVLLIAALVFAAFKSITYYQRISNLEFRSERYAQEMAKQIAAAKRPLAKNAPVLDWPVTNLAASGNTVLAGLPDGSYMISHDAGVSWEIKTAGDFNFEFNQSAIHPNGTWMLLSDRSNFEEQLIISRDKGLSWESVPLGESLPGESNYVRSIVMSPTGMLLVDTGGAWILCIH